jgi:predicted dehydrogenase
MEKLKFAVIGTGFWSTLQIPAWFDVGGVELVALYNRTTEKAKNAAKKYGNPRVYEDPDEMFKKEKLDFVDIITEVPAHEKFVLMAAKYRVPVICQKPMSFSYKSCIKMYKACRKAGIPFFVHENYRWMKPFRNLKKILEEDLIGKILYAEISLTNGGELSFINQPFLGILPHFIFMDMGPHIFDVSRFLFGEPKSVYARGMKAYDYIKGENIMHSVLDFGDMACTANVRQFLLDFAFIEGAKGSITLNLDNSIDIYSEKEKGKRRYDELDYPVWAEHVRGYVSPYEVHNIFDCNRSIYEALISNKKPETDASDNLKSMRIVFSAIESHLKNSVIKL